MVDTYIFLKKILLDFNKSNCTQKITASQSKEHSTTYIVQNTINKEQWV